MESSRKYQSAVDSEAAYTRYKMWLAGVHSTVAAQPLGLVQHAVPSIDVAHRLIHVSPDWLRAPRLLLLLSDTGGVSEGGLVWSRSERESVAPFVAHARTMGWAVAVMNPRGGTTAAMGDSRRTPLAEQRTGGAHLRYVWTSCVVAAAAAKEIAIVAHRTAAAFVAELFEAESTARERVGAVAFIDAHRSTTSFVLAHAAAVALALRDRTLAWVAHPHAPPGAKLTEAAGAAAGSGGVGWITVAGGVGESAAKGGGTRVGPSRAAAAAASPRSLTPNSIAMLVLDSLSHTVKLGSASCWVARESARRWSLDPTAAFVFHMKSSLVVMEGAEEVEAAVTVATAGRPVGLPTLAAQKKLDKGTISQREFDHIAEVSRNFPHRRSMEGALDDGVAKERDSNALVQWGGSPNDARAGAAVATPAPAAAATVPLDATTSLAAADTYTRSSRSRPRLPPTPPTRVPPTPASVSTEPAGSADDIDTSSSSTARHLLSRRERVAAFRAACDARRTALLPSLMLSGRRGGSKSRRVSTTAPQGIVLMLASLDDPATVIKSVLRRFSVCTTLELLIAPPRLFTEGGAVEKSLGAVFFDALLREAREGQSPLFESACVGEEDAGTILPRASAGQDRREQKKLVATGRVLLSLALHRGGAEETEGEKREGGSAGVLPAHLFAPTVWRQLLGDERAPVSDFIAFHATRAQLASSISPQGEASEAVTPERAFSFLVQDRRDALAALRRGFRETIDLGDAAMRGLSWRDLCAAMTTQ